MFKKVKESPLHYWEEKSYMQIISADENKDYLKDCLERIADIPNCTIKDKNIDVEKGFIRVKLDYEEDEYEVGIYPGMISVPPHYLNNSFYFTKEEKEIILKTTKAITIFMEFNDNYKKSYHLQLKLAIAINPDLVGVLDESAEKMLPGKWVNITATSKVLPNPKTLFTVHVVVEKNEGVWLHTHGLSRCKIPELEILNSDTENYRNHYNLLCTYALYLLDKKNTLPNFEVGCYIGRLIDGSPVVATSRPWPQGMKEYKHLKLGNLKDRKNNHNSKSNVIFLYKSEEDEERNLISKVSIYNELWGNNPIFYLSDEETLRMKALAIERFDYVKQAFKNKDNTIHIKIGLPLREKGKYEHIWFELLEIKDNKFKARLTQEPYEIPNMHTGDEAWYTKEEITDWIIYTKETSIEPDNVYILD